MIIWLHLVKYSYKFNVSKNLCTVLKCQRMVTANDLRLKEVGAFEAQIFFWKPHFKCKTIFH
jgi:hypothetical protein